MKESKYVREPEAARRTGFAVKSLQKRRWAGLPPSYYKVGSNVLYAVADLDEFLAKGRVER